MVEKKVGASWEEMGQKFRRYFQGDDEPEMKRRNINDLHNSVINLKRKFKVSSDLQKSLLIFF